MKITKYRKIEVIVLVSIISIIIWFMLTFIISYSSEGSGKKFAITKGTINISEWYNDNDTIIPLCGKWEFFWNKFVTFEDIKNGAKPDFFPDIPKVWNNYKIDGENLPGFGYGTYHLRVSGTQKGKEISLWIPTISTAYRLYINDELIVSRGSVSKKAAVGEPEYEPVQITYTPTDDHIDIIIQASNYTYSRGGMWYALYLGTPQQILNTKEGILCRDLFLLGSFLVMSFIYGTIYLLRRRENENLYFALLCIIAACRTLLHGSYFINVIFPFISVESIVRLDYVTLFWFPVLMGLMLEEMYKEDIKVGLQKFFNIYAIVMTVLILVTKVSFFTRLTYMAEIVMFIISIYLFIKMIFVMKCRKGDSIIIFIGSIIILASGTYDILFENTFVEGGLFELTPMGFFIMLLLQAYVLAKHFTEVIIKMENTLTELQVSSEREHKAELKFLKSQIRPHFIYNALNTIISISHKDIFRAQELLVEFSTYLRGCFDFKDLENVVSLEKELEFIKAYIILQQARFGESLQVEYDIEVINVMVPPLILQPIVENAVVHGIRQKANGGKILIYVKHYGEMIRIGVKDDGIGIEPERISQLTAGRDVSRGIGIYNITTRLHKIYGISLCIENIESGGLDVYMDLPYKGGNSDD